MWGESYSLHQRTFMNDMYVKTDSLGTTQKRFRRAFTGVMVENKIHRPVIKCRSTGFVLDKKHKKREKKCRVFTDEKVGKMSANLKLVWMNFFVCKYKHLEEVCLTVNGQHCQHLLWVYMPLYFFYEIYLYCNTSQVFMLNYTPSHRLTQPLRAIVFFTNLIVFVLWENILSSVILSH